MSKENILNYMNQIMLLNILFFFELFVHVQTYVGIHCHMRMNICHRSMDEMLSFFETLEGLLTVSKNSDFILYWSMWM